MEATSSWGPNMHGKKGKEREEDGDGTGGLLKGIEGDGGGGKTEKVDFFCMRNIFVIVLRRIKIFFGRKHVYTLYLSLLEKQSLMAGGRRMKPLRSLHAGSGLEKEGRKKEFPTPSSSCAQNAFCCLFPLTCGRRRKKGGGGGGRVPDQPASKKANNSPSLPFLFLLPFYEGSFWSDASPPKTAAYTRTQSVRRYGRRGKEESSFPRKTGAFPSR